MANRIDEPKKLRCSFCGKTSSQVRRLIAGHEGAHICDECIDTCAEILEEEFEAYEDSAEDLGINLLKPKEIKEFLEAYHAGNKEETEKELGDVLFAVVNVGRKAGCDAEKALKESAERFAKRFTEAEKLALADGKVVTELTEKEWDEYYVTAKKNLQQK